MRSLLTFAFLCLGLAASAAELVLGPAGQQLIAAADTPAQYGARWSDNQPILLPSAVISEGSSPVAETESPAPARKSVWPPSPVENAKDYQGFEKGFTIGFSGVEWTPNLVANAAPGLGTVLGGLLGIGLLPVGIIAGFVGGSVAAVAGFFS